MGIGIRDDLVDRVSISVEADKVLALLQVQRELKEQLLLVLADGENNLWVFPLCYMARMLPLILLVLHCLHPLVRDLEY